MNPDLAEFVLAREGHLGLAARIAEARLQYTQEHYGDYHTGKRDGLDYALLLIACLYTHHPDYREEWRP